MFQPHWLNWCFHHLNQAGVLLKGLAMGVCESSVHMCWNEPQGWKENHVLVLLVQEPFHVATFLLFCYNGSASIMNKSSIPALTFFLQWVIKYSMFLVQLILHFSSPGFGVCSGRLLPGWVWKWWDWSVPAMPGEALRAQWLKLSLCPLLKWGTFSVMTAAPIQKDPGFKISFCLDRSL